MTYLCKFSKIQLIGSGDIVITRSGHANANADTNGIRTETDIAPSLSLVFGSILGKMNMKNSWPWSKNGN